MFVITRIFLESESMILPIIKALMIEPTPKGSMQYKAVEVFSWSDHYSLFSIVSFIILTKIEAIPALIAVDKSKG